MAEQDETQKELTFGQRAVGIKFNPSEGDQHDKVARIKTLMAEVIDIVHDDSIERNGGPAGSPDVLTNILEVGAYHSLIGGQMAAVKAVTWPKK